MKNNESDKNEPDLREISGDNAAASMAEKLQGVQFVASRHGFKFLAYMLDMARAEADSLRNDDPHR